MSFTTEQFKQLYQALLSAFPNVGELKIFARTELGQDLDQIAGGNTLAEVVFALIQWADAEGRSDELVRLANQKKPKNPLLSLFATQYFNLSATPTQKDGTAGETRAPEDAMQGQIAPKAEHFPSRFDLKGVLIGCLFTITVVTLVIAGFTFIHLPF